MVATHSHLFINRRNPRANLLVQRREGRVSLDPVVSVEQLYDLTFQMLGNSTEDLFFPGNFLVVEGSSDQVIVEKVRSLLDVPASKVKVLSATGVDRVPATIEAIQRVLSPIVTRDSPYANRVVAMIDRSRPSSSVDDLGRVLGDRLFVLTEPSIEEYIPGEIFTKAGRNKAIDIQRMQALKNNYPELVVFKKDLSQLLVAHLAAEDLKRLEIVVSAVQKASK